MMQDASSLGDVQRDATPRGRWESVTHRACGSQGWRNIDVQLCVLGSGSRGNCSVLRMVQERSGEVGRIERRHSLCLVDLGFSPKWTAGSLLRVGCQISDVDTVLITHLDMDHCHPRWGDGLPRHAEVFVPRGHLPRAYQRGLNRGVLAHFAGQGRQPTGETAKFETHSGLRVEALMTFHDELGSAVFRVDVDVEVEGMLRTARLGYATDLGRASDELLAFLEPSTGSGRVMRQRGLFDELGDEHVASGGRPAVDVLAIESNYCPQMQAASDRPMFLKQRITGGRGHLSNQESAEIVTRARPTKAAVLLHLSRQCNRPELAVEVHERARGADGGWGVVASDQIEPSPWISLVSGEVMAPGGKELVGMGLEGMKLEGKKVDGKGCGDTGQGGEASLGLLAAEELTQTVAKR